MPPIVKNIFVNNVQKEIKHFPYSQILLPAKREPIIPIPSNTYTVREHSNILYSEVLGKYVFCWSQGPIPYDSTDIYVHMAISDNIDSGWQIIGNVVGIPSEDPFIVEEDGTLYILFEKKINVGGRPDDIGLYKLTDQNDLLNGWTDLGHGLQKDPSKEWQDFDISSPTYYRSNGISYIYFEGRGTSNGITQEGAVGMATSTGIEDVFTHTNLIIGGTGFDGRTPDLNWGSHVVPDDVFVINGTYYMTAHVFTNFGSEAYTAVFSSGSLDSGWVDVFGCEINYSNKITNANGQGVNFYDGKAFVIENNEVFLARWGVGHKNTPFLKDITKKSNTTDVKLIGSSFFSGKNDNDFAQVRDIKESESSTFRSFREVYLSGDSKFYLDRPIEFLMGVFVNGDFIDEQDLQVNKEYGTISILTGILANDIVNVKYKSDNSTMLLSYDSSSSLNLLIRTASGDDWEIDWGDGVWERYVSSSTYRTKTFSSSTSGVARVRSATGRRLSDISRFESTGSTAWNFDLGVFVPLTGLTVFWLNDLPNANITGSINSFSGANGLTSFQLFNLPNANINGSINSFSNATGLINFQIYNLPSGNITGDSSAFSNMTNLRDFLLLTSLNSTISMNYDDILNIWQNTSRIWHRYSGISASKATNDPFNFTGIRGATLYFESIGLSTASMDNMIIALDNSLIAQISPKTIYLNGNAPHSGSPAVMTALSNLASKNITVVL